MHAINTKTWETEGLLPVDKFLWVFGCLTCQQNFEQSVHKWLLLTRQCKMQLHSKEINVNHEPKKGEKNGREPTISSGHWGNAC